MNSRQNYKLLKRFKIKIWMPQLKFQSKIINTIHRIYWDLFYMQTNIDLDITLPIHVEIPVVTSVNKIIICRQSIWY